ATAHRYTTDVERIYTVTLTVTDSEARQAQEMHTVTVSPPEPAPPSPTVEFIWPFHYDASGEDAASLNDEYFTLENSGTEPVDLTGWSVSNERGDTFRFPDRFTLAPGAIVMIHSGAGANSAEILYWNAAEPMWNNTTDIAILYDADGDIVDVYAYASC
ncbi:MAG: lamin tail domain-containing protein, partial [Candidatus Bipolaricaulis sp.]|nr:lamin tail domain-containing protein [Candidatus Bipolaricaulis sp.]